MSSEENKEFSIPEELTANHEELIEKLKHEPEPKEDKPKIRNRCRDCVAFHTHFCPFWDTDHARAAPLGSDYACCDFWARPNLKLRPLTYDHFLRNVENI